MVTNFRGSKRESLIRALRAIYFHQEIASSRRANEKRNVTLTNVNLCPHGRRIELLWLSRDLPSRRPCTLRPIVNQIALASQMHIHGKRMADYTGFVAPRLPEGCFASLGKGFRAYLSRQNDVVNVHDIVPLLLSLLRPCLFIRAVL